MAEPKRIPVNIPARAGAVWKRFRGRRPELSDSAMVELAIRIADEITQTCRDVLDHSSKQGPGRPRIFARSPRPDGTLGPEEPLEPVIFSTRQLDALQMARWEDQDEAEGMFSAMGAGEPPVPEFLRKPEGD